MEYILPVFKEFLFFSTLKKKKKEKRKKQKPKNIV